MQPEGNGSMENGGNDSAPADVGRTEKRAPHSIRFSGAEWERVEAVAGRRGLTPAEFVRLAALAATDDVSGLWQNPGRIDRLAPLIERTFRYSYMLATRMRDDMCANGQDEELNALIDAARALQQELLTDGRE